LLYYIKRPLIVLEITEGITVEFRDNLRCNIDRRLNDKNNIRRIYLNFIKIDFHFNDNKFIVYIVYFLVQEYLELERIY